MGYIQNILGQYMGNSTSPGTDQIENNERKTAHTLKLKRRQYDKFQGAGMEISTSNGHAVFENIQKNCAGRF